MLEWASLSCARSTGAVPGLIMTIMSLPTSTKSTFRRRHVCERAPRLHFCLLPRSPWRLCPAGRCSLDRLKVPIAHGGYNAGVDPVVRPALGAPNQEQVAGLMCSAVCHSLGGCTVSSPREWAMAASSSQESVYHSSCPSACPSTVVANPAHHGTSWPRQ